MNGIPNYLDPHNVNPSCGISPAFNPPFNWCGEMPIGAPFDEFGMTHTFEDDDIWIDGKVLVEKRVDFFNGKTIDINRIAYCGCGGVGKKGKLVLGFNNEQDVSYYYACSLCDIQTTTYPTEEEAQKAWNIAMGVKYE